MPEVDREQTQFIDKLLDLGILREEMGGGYKIYLPLLPKNWSSHS